jgi:hypothetical protein
MVLALDNANTVFEWTAVPPSEVTLHRWYEELANELIKTGKCSFKKFLVASPDIVCLLEHSLKFRHVQDNNTYGIWQTGTLGELLVFVDPFFPIDRILLAAGTLDDPENLVIRDPIKVKVKNILDTY